MSLPHSRVVNHASIEPLEDRRLFAVVAPTNAEQYLVELVNRARADPLAEAARYGIDLNEGLAAGTISSTPKQPLAINGALVDSARGHSQWMIDNDVFSHTGAGGSTPLSRMQAAGYTFGSPWKAGENISWRGTKPSVPDLVATTTRIHQDLFVDDIVPGRGHRLNIMDGEFNEIGAGVVAGEFQTYNAVMATQDFAFTGTRSFLTGVAYTDAVVHDNFYTPGEGLGGVTVAARRASDGATFSTTTWSCGGYSLPLAAGTYDVTASGAALNGTVRFSNVVVGTQNVKRDFLPSAATPTTNITGRHVFYNNSAYDGRDPAATLADLNAVAPDKEALRPGGVASFTNMTGYSGGINGVLVDFAGIPPTTLTADDFLFRSGPGINPALWPAAPAPASVVELPNPTGSNTARYAITWPDGAIKNTWLQVTVKADADTGLTADDVFYFGNLVGETGDSPAAMRVTALDIAAIKRTLGTSATLDARTDFNRDGKINALDLAAAKANLSRTIDLLSPP